MFCPRLIIMFIGPETSRHVLFLRGGWSCFGLSDAIKSVLRLPCSGCYSPLPTKTASRRRIVASSRLSCAGITQPNSARLGNPAPPYLHRHELFSRRLLEVPQSADLHLLPILPATVLSR